MSKASEQQEAQMALSLGNRRKPADEKPAPRVRAPRVKPVRITVDLDPDLHRRTKLWALEHDGAKLADVVRELLTQLLEQDAELSPELQNAVATALLQRDGR